MNQEEREIMDEGLQDYEEEMREREERMKLGKKDETFWGFLRREEEKERKETERIETFARDYLDSHLKKNPNEICSRCYLRGCGLTNGLYECGYVGLKIKVKDNEAHKLKMLKIKRYESSEDGIFPLTKNQIKNMTIIN